MAIDNIYFKDAKNALWKLSRLFMKQCCWFVRVPAVPTPFLASGGGGDTLFAPRAVLLFLSERTMASAWWKTFLFPVDCQKVIWVPSPGNALLYISKSGLGLNMNFKRNNLKDKKTVKIYWVSSLILIATRNIPRTCFTVKFNLEVLHNMHQHKAVISQKRKTHANDS
jgi:hypothetical protein